MKAFLILEDGTVFHGKSFGASKEIVSEVVFNTCMTGYVESLTDPSYAGQALTMTYPLIGNYGVNREDMESKRIWASALIVRELSRVASNFRTELTLEEFLLEYDVPGIQGIDTRKLTKILRSKGTMNGMITTNERRLAPEHFAQTLAEIGAYRCAFPIQTVSQKGYSRDTHQTYKVAVFDFGIKKSIVEKLMTRGCDVISFPYDAKAEEILATNPDGILLGNGPGDPTQSPEIIANVKKLVASNVPIFGICMGHQLIALANGATTSKLKYGHRGGNHPVKDLRTGRVYITSQNHGYVIDEGSVDPKVAKVSHRNVNDGTIEGLAYENGRCFTVQYHPEACGGPLDTEYLFDEFITMMEEQK